MTDFDNEAVHWTVEENDYYDDQVVCIKQYIQVSLLNSMNRMEHPQVNLILFRIWIK